MNPLIQLKTSIPLFLVALTCFALSPNAQAVNPPPDGGYPGRNTAEGTDALFSLTTGTGNTAIGFNALFNNTTGRSNTASGAHALFANTTGRSNTATGWAALANNTEGFGNTATGVSALNSNTLGTQNTATGFQALQHNTTGQQNTATGSFALSANIGDFNTAYGSHALSRNTTGALNTACGVGALQNNVTGDLNTAIGVGALLANRGGSSNTAIGHDALLVGSGGQHNTAVGFLTLSNTTGSGNIAIGSNAGFDLHTGHNNIYIGNSGLRSESSTIRIGQFEGTHHAAFIAGITGVPVAGNPVTIDSFGQLGVAPSCARFKDAIKPMDKASETIFALEPVTFHYKKEIDPAGTSQFGLVAEDVEKVNPDLVVRDADGKPYTVRYEAVNAMLLNEFLKEHRKNEEQQATITRLQKQVEALTAGVQKVSAQVEMSRSAPQMAVNDQ